MNELTQNIQKMMVPKAAIIAYKYEDRRNSDTRYFIELRPIGKSGQMGAGIPEDRKNISGTIRPERDRCSFTRISIYRTAYSICRELFIM